MKFQFIFDLKVKVNVHTTLSEVELIVAELWFSALRAALLPIAARSHLYLGNVSLGRRRLKGVRWSLYYLQLPNTRLRWQWPPNGTFLTHRSLSGCPRAAQAVPVRLKLPLRKTLSLSSTCQVRTVPSSTGVEDLSNIRALEEEIMELQEYNARVESEMFQLRTDITQMEPPLRPTDRESPLSTAPKTNQLSEYYESLRNNFINLLDHVRLPNFDERPTPDNFDTYLNRLQSLCADNSKDDAGFSTVKQAMQDFAAPL
ncbi:myelin transcription factor 1 [Caerostris extrusa]|uniref:Myelin transcription factor 1 n=1 Tax=Caerostris extrusa TaxID=172846 RepID=A0AAV4VWC6_CAEEX|nr:myelin transcription factor 1 [Caerostris extrusa]